jgi:PAS domain S-box-containing protein
MTPVDASALDQALARAGDGVTVVSSDGRIVLWNRAAERILGYTAREVAGRSCCDVFAGRDDHGNKVCHPGCHVMTLVRMTEPVQHFDMLAQAKSGQTVWLDVSVMALQTNGRGNGYSQPGGGGNGGNGHTNGFMVMHMFRDVTATKELLAVVRERFAAPPAAEGAIEGGAALTRRELEVLRLVAQGGNTKIVAEKLHVSPATIRNHVQNILGKLGAHSRLEAVAYATRHRLL